jgi:hypothetical protein
MKMRLAFCFMGLAAVLSATGCAVPREHNLPPAERLAHPGPGVDGPGPGVLAPAVATMAPFACGPQGGAMMPDAGVMAASAQVLFAKPEGMQVRWDVVAAFDSTPLVVPGRRNFPQAAIYRLKLTNIAGREGVELYPTLEIGPTTPRTEAYLAHNAIPVQFTEEDFDQVLAGNFVTKVIYLPDPEFQELALAGVETLVSTRLDPGIDPITEADRRGAILAVIRLGNKDVELPGSNGNVAPTIPGSPRVGSGVTPAAFYAAAGMAGGPMAMGPSGLIPQHVAGISTPEYGMPMSGTPIGLPGPPHIPYGGPAGLQKHVMKNYTRVHIPEPTRQVTVGVRQVPGYSYPQPPNRAFISEHMLSPSLPYDQPRIMRHETVE